MINQDSVDVRFQDAVESYTNGDAIGAFHVFCENAAAGHLESMGYLAEMFLRGEGVAQDVNRAIELLETASSQGQSVASYNLGALFRNGDCGIQIDQELSQRYFRLVPFSADNIRIAAAGWAR